MILAQWVKRKILRLFQVLAAKQRLQFEYFFSSSGQTQDSVNYSSHKLTKHKLI